MFRLWIACLNLLLVSPIFLCNSSLLYAEESDANAIPPNPQSLKPNWWEYFKVDRNTFYARSDTLLKSLEGVKSTRPECAPLIDRINEGMYSLINWQNPEVISLPVANYQESYTITELKNLAIQLNHLNRTQASESLQLKHCKENLSDDRTFLDNLVATYIALPVDHESRLEKGLEIMATKVQVENDINKLAELEARNKFTDATIEATKKEIEVARRNLSDANVNRNLIYKNIEKADQQLLKAQQALEKRQRDFRAEERRRRLDDVTRSPFLQDIMNLSILEAFANISLITHQIELTLVDLIYQDTPKDIPAIYKKIDSWNEKIHKNDREQEDWKQATLLELDKALQKLSAEPDSAQIKRLKSTVALAEESMVNMQKFEAEKYLAGFLIDQTGIVLRSKSSSFGEKISSGWHAFVLFFKTHSQWFHRSLFKIGDTPLTPISLLKFFIYLAMSYLIAFYARHSLKKLGTRHHRMSPSGLYALSRLGFYAIFLLGTLLSITTIGIDFTAITVIAGALSVGIGFGLQSIVNNFVAGVILLLEKKVRIGDFIELDSGDRGNVKEVNMRTTLIRTHDNIELLIPNSEIISKKVANWTLTDKSRRIRVPFGVAFETDKDFLKKVLVEAAKDVPITLPSPEPNIWLISLGESSLNFELVVWINEDVPGLTPMIAAARYLWVIEDTLRKNNIKIPYPIRDIHVQNSSESQLVATEK